MVTYIEPMTDLLALLLLATPVTLLLLGVCWFFMER